jgi:hypothetical protein
MAEYTMTMTPEFEATLRREQADAHGNLIAREGCDRSTCGCKYWEGDHCIDCGEYVVSVLSVADLIGRGLA